MKPKKNKTNEAWIKLLEKYDIVNEVEKNGLLSISADEIKEFREPRLMAKWDTCNSRPESLLDEKLDILPTSRGTYAMGKFNCYQELPTSYTEKSIDMYFTFPKYDTLNKDDRLVNESTAISLLNEKKLLNKFLNSPTQFFPTMNGRMGTNEFDFSINSFENEKINIKVSKAQCEIDAVFENDTDVVIIEAKNKLISSFNIRQLYFPFRLVKSKTNKNVRNVFMVTSNEKFWLFEYVFTNVNDFSSIKLVREAVYSYEDRDIKLDDIKNIFDNIDTKILTTYKERDNILIQANNMEYIFNLIEFLKDGKKSTNEVATEMDFVKRQSDYYFNAAKYVNLVKKDRKKDIELTKVGKQLSKLNFREKKLRLIEQIFKDKTFYELMKLYFQNGILPSDSDIEKELNKVQNENRINSTTIKRRISSIKAWLRWIIDTANDKIIE